jgi:hypothetical protein
MEKENMAKYKCDKCGKIDSRSAIDIGVDLESIGAMCSCGGRWIEYEGVEKMEKENMTKIKEIEEMIEKANELATDDENEAWDFFVGDIVYDNGEDLVVLVDNVYVGWQNKYRMWYKLTTEESEDEEGPDWSSGTYRVKRSD